MGLLKQNSTSPTSYYGWYGVCDQTDCNTSFDLQSEPRIIGAAGRDDESEINYYRVNPFFSSLKELKCGQAYKITIDSGLGEINIPDFTMIDDPSNSQILITNCNNEEVSASSLKQNSTSPTSYYGWYGICNRTDCTQTFDLQSEPRILGAVGRNDQSEINYYRVNPFFSSLKELRCGQAYKITVESGEGEVIISNFIASDVANNNSQILTTICDNSDQPNDDIIQTPTPTPNPTPTPTPTPTPQKITPIQNTPKTILKIPVILLKWDTGSLQTSLTFNKFKLKLTDNKDATRRMGTIQDLENYLNSENYNWPPSPDEDRPTGSVQEYFKSISFGQLEVQFKIVPAGSNPNPKSNNLDEYAYDIGQDFKKYGGLRTIKRDLKKVMTLASAKAKQNYWKLGKKFDKQNQQGEFASDEQIAFIHAGLGAEEYSFDGSRSGFVHSHKSKFSDRLINNNGSVSNLRINRVYTVQPYRRLLGTVSSNYLKALEESTINTIGVFAHESGHAFDIRDQYDKMGGAGVGNLALMANGNSGISDDGSSRGTTGRKSGHLPSFATSFAREHIGIDEKYFDVEVIEYRSSQKDIEIYPVTEKNVIHKIYHPNDTDVWYIEYRSKKANAYLINYDKLIVKNGLAIFQVPDKTNSKSPMLEIPDHSRGENGYFISTESQSGKFGLERSGENFAKTIPSQHLFQDGDEFSPFTYPSTVSRNGIPSGIKIHNIRTKNNGTMLFDLDFLNEPNEKIVSIDYSWGNSNYDINTTQRNRLNKANRFRNYTITITTENISNGSKINLQINPGYNSNVIKSGVVNNNKCIIDLIAGDYDFTNKFRYSRWSETADLHVQNVRKKLTFGTPNYFRYFVDSSDDIFPWTDIVMGIA